MRKTNVDLKERKIKRESREQYLKICLVCAFCYCQRTKKHEDQKGRDIKEDRDRYREKKKFRRIETDNEL